jgi:predicted amidohydrolase
MESLSGDFDANLDKVVKGMERAEREGVQIVSFPECFLTGYQDNEAMTRRYAFPVDSPRMRAVLDRTRPFDATVIVGFNEARGGDLYNTALVGRRGELLGTYSKCFAYMPFHRQGRAFPVFERDGVKFGIVICADGGYIEPARILALKGAKVIFSPHFNYIAKEGLIRHFQMVRADHTARAVENRVHFLRGNNVVLGRNEGFPSYEGVGYGDSYLVDPYGEILVRSRRHQEDFISAEIDPSITDRAWKMGQSRYSILELHRHLMEAAGEGTKSA